MMKVCGHHIRLSHPSCRFVPMLVDGNRCDVLGVLCRWKDGALPDVTRKLWVIICRNVSVIEDPETEQL